MTPTVFRRSAAILGESLVWAPRTSSVLWCDITAGLIHRSPIDGPVDGSLDTTIALPAPVGSFHPADLGGHPGLVVSLGDRVVLTDADGTIVRELATIRHAHAGLRLNEGKVDPRGWWITGSMNLTTGAPDGAFYSIARDGELRVLVGGIAVANGLEWSLDGSHIYFTDTGAQTVYRGRYSSAGEISDVEVFHHGDRHDGLAADQDGNFWGAIYGAGRVVKYDASGEEQLAIELPAPNVTSVAFGGPGLSTLFVASARENLTEQQLVDHPLSGSVFAITTSTRGRPANVFSAGRVRRS